MEAVEVSGRVSSGGSVSMGLIPFDMVMVLTQACPSSYCFYI